MDIARTKRRENIAEYILYIWQLEDLLMALQFSPEAVYSQLVQPRGLEPDAQQELLVWYMELAGLLAGEGKEQAGHLDHTLHLVADLQNLHEQLLASPAGDRYRPLYASLAAELPRLRGILGGSKSVDAAGMGDIELAFRALYAAMLYKIRGGEKAQKAFADVTEVVSPAIAELAKAYRLVEIGELDLAARAEE
jgi:hypothetical protein